MTHHTVLDADIIPSSSPHVFRRKWYRDWVHHGYLQPACKQHEQRGYSTDHTYVFNASLRTGTSKNMSYPARTIAADATVVAAATHAAAPHDRTISRVLHSYRLITY